MDYPIYKKISFPYEGVINLAPPVVTSCTLSNPSQYYYVKRVLFRIRIAISIDYKWCILYILHGVW